MNGARETAAAGEGSEQQRERQRQQKEGTRAGNKRGGLRGKELGTATECVEAAGKKEEEASCAERLRASVLRGGGRQNSSRLLRASLTLCSSRLATSEMEHVG